MSFVVAIDGPAASGKGTIARALAQRFGLAHLDTGTLYRAVARKALTAGAGTLDPAAAARAAEALTPDDLADDASLRTAEVSRAASAVAALPEVRRALLDFQRRFAAREPGAVLDGRDIGTVVCPDAAVKLFVTAVPETRARRRAAELAERGTPLRVEDVLADLRARDARDAARETAPLKQAADAHLLDTTELDIDGAVARAAEIVEQALSRAQG